MSNNWRTIPLSEIADINPRLGKTALIDAEEFAFVPMAAVGAADGTIDVTAKRAYADVKKGFTPFQSGDVLFAKITPCMENGKMAVVPHLENQYGFGSTEFHVIRPKAGIDAKYLYYFVSRQDYRKEASHHMTGAVGQKRVPTDFLKQSIISIPSELRDQQRIVAEIEKHFSRLDEAVNGLKRIQANLKRYKAAVLKAAVEGKLTEQWRKEHPDVERADQLLKRILAERRAKWEAEELAKMKAKGIKPKDDSWKKKYKEPAGPDAADLPELPEGWVWATVDQLAEVGTGATPLRSKKEYYEHGIIPWVTSGALNDLCITKADEYITNLAVSETNAKIFPSRTLLLAMYGEGKTRGKVSELLIDAATNQACAAIVFTGIGETVRPYAKLFFRKNYEDIRRLSSGGVQPNLNLGHIKSTVLPIPPLDEQGKFFEEIERLLSVTEELEVTIETNLKRTEQLRQRVLQRAFAAGFG